MAVSPDTSTWVPSLWGRMVPRTGYPGDDDFSPVPVGTDGSSHRPPHGEQTPSRPCGDGWFYIDDAPRIVNDCPVHTWTDGSDIGVRTAVEKRSRPCGDG